MTSKKVGDKIVVGPDRPRITHGLDQLNQLPKRTVVIDPQGVPRVCLGHGRTFFAQEGTYEIVWMPPNPIQELAADLAKTWMTAQTALSDEDKWGIIARHILERYELRGNS